MDNGHSLAKLQILCAPSNVFARFFASAGVFRRCRCPSTGRSLQRQGSDCRCAPISRRLWGAPVRTAGESARGRFDAEKNGRLFGENAGEWAKCPRLFSKSPRWRSGGRPRSVAPSPLCAKRWEPGVRKPDAHPPVCPFRRLRCGEIAVFRCGESESPLVRFDAKA